MPPKIVLLGTVLATLLSGTVVVAVAQEWWWLAAAGAMALLSATFLVAVDLHHRVRALRSWSQRELRRMDRSLARVRSGVQELVTEEREPPAPAVTADTAGTVRVLQAQYLGRLDRMQAAIDSAVAELAARSAPGDREP